MPQEAATEALLQVETARTEPFTASDHSQVLQHMHVGLHAAQ